MDKEQKIHAGMPVRILVAAMGLILSGIGVGIFLYSSLGVDPASVFELGVAKQLHISYGTASALLNVLILAIVFFVDKKYLNISSLLAIFLIGYTADIMKLVLSAFIPAQLPLIVRIVFILIGCAIMSVGIGTYITAELGVGAIDLVSQIISDKTRFPYRWVRVVGDVSFVVIGFLLGGAVGLGTVVGAFLTGPMVQFFRPLVFKITDRVLKKH